ncbi:MAG TPA: bifunctional phosphoribosylaminoimidazolecarboxamide formyltransferase/IMP cyclohydrolase [Planctomycetes bacterium]|nr:bifunctional phosphoribosylaminoimidazolecarboxamide formyltransferase/IMP cyclohydrolase [Planctomycetota bacterium]HIL52355.1 bifunctional phosphoribosylaminoimidazolecarboxamide formyltransferase/IMP cyclohydrolase [Planctomycetota bacterium]
MKVKIRRALISVSDKEGIENFARALVEMGVELLSTGGTFAAIEAGGVAVTEVAEYTGFPEMMGGRVKTLHPKVHGGILALRDETEHTQAMAAHGIEGIDLVVVNLYPFEKTVAKPGVKRAAAIEEIDIGGPSMVRSAAKNHRFVGIVTEPTDYGRVLDEMQRKDSSIGEDLRRELACKAFALTARYDAAISRWMAEQEISDGKTCQAFPESFAVAGVKTLDLRYGENPHQQAAFYKTSATDEASVASAEVLNGKALSFNNLVDLDAAHALAKEFVEPFVAVTKHNNPCGAASAATIEEALEAAWAGDPLSAFGSVLAFTRPVNLACASFLVEGNRFVEAIIAPSFDTDAFALLTDKPRWGKNVRLLACGEYGPDSRRPLDIELKKLVGGFLLQGRDLAATGLENLNCVTQTRASDQEISALLFAERIAKHVKSNAIVLARGTRVLGVGAGQMSRVDAVRLAIHKAGDDVAGAVLASDAFFPFPDGVETAIAAGVGAILQPGGSMRDNLVIAACDQHKTAMVFTGERHFRH